MGESNSSGAIPDAGGKKEFTSSAKLKRAELREHSRFRVEDAKTEIYLKGFLAKLGLGRKNEARVAVNLSEGGILVSTHGKLAPGTKVKAAMLHSIKARGLLGKGARMKVEKAAQAADGDSRPLPVVPAAGDSQER